MSWWPSAPCSSPYSLIRISVPPADPVEIDSPLAGEWRTVAGGRSVLLSHHFSPETPKVTNALDFVRIVDGQGYVGDPKRLAAWHGFDQPVFAPAEGTVVAVSDVYPDEPVGQTGVTPPHGNHIVLDIGDRHYAVLAHLKKGSAQVSNGERVRAGNHARSCSSSPLRLATSSTKTSPAAKPSCWPCCGARWAQQSFYPMSVPRGREPRNSAPIDQVERRGRAIGAHLRRESAPSWSPTSRSVRRRRRRPRSGAAGCGRR